MQVRVLLTAFEPYDQWSSNSSWLALVELLKEFPPGGELVTRRYPVDLPAVRDKLAQDLKRPFDVVLHLGQSPGASCVKLEAIAINAAGLTDTRNDELEEIVPGGPVAYRSRIPLAHWSALLRRENIPSKISYHAGTYLCNATMYLSHHILSAREREGLQPACSVGFVHLPLATEQVLDHHQAMPSLPISMLAKALRVLVEDLQHSSASTREEVA